MLKYKEYIEKLTVAQKIALLVQASAAEQAGTPELPRLGLAELWESNKGEGADALFPRAESISNAWSTSLMEDVATCLAEMGTKRGTNLFVLPETQAPYSIYGRGLSEEPLLTAALVGAAADALHQKGVGVCAHAPLVTEDDVSCLQGEADPRVLYERTAEPFLGAVGKRGCHAILMPKDAPAAACEKENAEMRRRIPQQASEVCLGVGHDQTVTALVGQKLLLGASALAVEAALENYNQILHLIEKGSATAAELNDAVAEGSAISEEMLDEALDRRLCLAAACSGQRDAAQRFADKEAREALALRAARESIVLLKNEKKTLPLSTKKRVALIGDMLGQQSEELAAQLRQQGCTVVGYERGYALDRDRGEELTDAAISLLHGADIGIVFLGLGKQREAMMPTVNSLKLPANQLALVNAVFETAKPVIVVVMGGRLPAMAFDRRAKAVLFAPAEGKQLSTALAEVLSGSYNPCGRLSFAGYAKPDEAYRETQRLLRRGRKKIGPFIGYRYAVSELSKTKYPFGFGLSYNEVKYSKLRLDGRVARFKLHNKGKRPVVETVQLYIGLEESARLRPLVELKSFLRVELAAGESRKIEIPLGDWSLYDPVRGEKVLEGGQYTVYIASSAEDVRLAAQIKITGSRLEPDGLLHADYLHSIPDICSKQYVMEGCCEPMKTKTKLKVWGLKAWGVLLVWLTLFADVLYATAGMLELILFEDTMTVVIGASIGVLCVGVLLLSVYKRKYNEVLRQQEEKERKATEAIFRDVEHIEGADITKLFASEFDIPVARFQHEEEHPYPDKEENLYAYMTVNTDLPTLSADMERFFKEHGIVLSPAFVKSTLASLMTARLLIVRTSTDKLFERFVEVLGKFFGTESSCELLPTEGTLLCGKLPNGQACETAIANTLRTAQLQREKAYFAAAAQVPLARMGRLLMPYTRYLSNPQEGCYVTEEDVTVELSRNAWFVFGVADGSSLADLDPIVSNFAAVLDLSAEVGREKSEKTAVQSVTCAEMEALVYRSKQKSHMEEELWKLVDRLEAFVAEHVPYRIGNKQCLQMERYLAVYEGCGGQVKSALDGVVATKLLPAILALLKDVSREAEIDLAQTVESIFGEEYTEQCRYLIKHAVWQTEVAPKGKGKQEVSDDAE